MNGNSNIYYIRRRIMRSCRKKSRLPHLMLWAGFHTGSGQAHDPARILRMPSGVLMGGLLLGGGLFLGVHAAREFADGGGEWKKRMLIALAMLVPGGILVSLTL